MSLSKSFNYRKKGMSYARVIHKKREEKVLKNWSSVRDIKKQWVLRCPHEKRKKKDE
jgi:hypothetical protein